MSYAHGASWGKERDLKRLLIKGFGGQRDFIVGIRFGDEEEQVPDFKINKRA